MFTSQVLQTYQVNKLYRYVNSLHINKFLKHEILREDILYGKMSAYLYYPMLFNKGISYNNYDDINKLCIAGYLYYRSIVLMDSLIDNEKIQNKNNPLILSVLQEESIKILTSLFPLENRFWHIWNRRRDELINSMNSCCQSGSYISLDDFETLADQKSAFGKIAIDSLFYISDQKDEFIYNELLLSHRYFSTGFQICDDIIDFSEDIENNQINIAICETKKYLDNNMIIYSEWDVQKLNKALYICGIAENLLRLSIEYFGKALKIAETHKLNVWVETINNKLNHAIWMCRECELAVIVANEKALLSVKLSVTKKLFANTLDNSLSTQIDTSTKGGILYINNLRDERSVWKDLFFQKGLSDVLVTAIVASNIADILSENPQDSKLVENFLLSNIHSGVSRSQSHGIRDIVSTIATLTYFKKRKLTSLIVDEKWTEAQKSDFGFSRFLSKEEIVNYFNDGRFNVSEWYKSHVCVSAIVYSYLCKYDKESSVLPSTKSYLLSQMAENYSWDSYWWTSPIFSTSTILQGLIIENHQSNVDLVDNIAKNLWSLKKENNSFENSPYYSSLILIAMCSSEYIFSKFLHEIDNLVIWLLANQCADGSWESQEFLIIPSPCKKSIGSHKFSKKDDSKVKELTRVLTTSTVLSGLSYYKKMISNFKDK